MKIRKLVAAAVAAVLTAGMLAGCGGGRKNYVVLDEALSSEEYGIGFRKEDAALRNEVWKLLVEMNQNGEFETISKKWFGENVSKLPDSYEPEEATDDSLQKIKDKGKLVLGLDVALPPMGFRDEDGNITGFDIDLAKAVCKKLGVELEPHHLGQQGEGAQRQKNRCGVERHDHHRRAQRSHEYDPRLYGQPPGAGGDGGVRHQVKR